MTITFFAIALASGLACPPTITDRQTVVEAADGWQVTTGNWPRELGAVLVFSGPPESHLQILGSKWKRGGMRWDFGGDEEVWVQCEYLSSATRLVKNFGKVRSCEYLPQEGGGTQGASFSCSL